jgi:hypothetical protein
MTKHSYTDTEFKKSVIARFNRMEKKFDFIINKLMPDLKSEQEKAYRIKLRQTLFGKQS